jgi:hypothetical protein
VVGEAMAARYGAVDLEPLLNGPPRWQPHLGKAGAYAWCAAAGSRRVPDAVTGS